MKSATAAAWTIEARECVTQSPRTLVSGGPSGQASPANDLQAASTALANLDWRSGGRSFRDWRAKSDPPSTRYHYIVTNGNY